MIRFLFSDNPGKEVIKQVVTLSTSAFGLIAALAWSDAIQSLVNKYLSAGGQLISKFVYALLVTLLFIVATVQLAKLKQTFAFEGELAWRKEQN
jgi:S-methylmethionine-dependent homocysteine/selenocysteine methylase